MLKRTDDRATYIPFVCDKVMLDADEMSFSTREKSSLNNRDICMTKNQAAKQQSKNLMLTIGGGFLGRNRAVVAHSLNMGMLL